MALFVTAGLAGVLLRARGGSGPTGLEAAERSEEGSWLRGLAARYEASLHWCLGHARAVLLGSGLIVLLSVGIYLRLGSGFLPPTDEGAFVLDYVMPAGTSLLETHRVLSHIERFLLETPEVESYSLRVGARLALAIAEPNTGDFLVKLRRSRKRSLEEVTDDLRRRINRAEPVIEVEFPHILEDLIGDLAWSPQPIEIKVYHDDPAVFTAVAHAIEEWLPKVKGVVDGFNRNVVIGPAANFPLHPHTSTRSRSPVDTLTP